jgi:hypothetical protein
MSSVDDHSSASQQSAVTESPKIDGLPAQLVSDRYHTNEISFDLPPGLKDKTHHVFTITDNGPSPFTLVISQSSIEAEDTLDAIAKRLVLELGRSLQQFRSIRQAEPIEVAGQQGCMLEYSWVQQGVKMQQKQVCLLRESVERRQLIQIAATSTNQGSQGLAWALRFEQILATVQFRQPEE